MCAYIVLAAIAISLVVGWGAHRLFKTDDRWINDASEF